MLDSIKELIDKIRMGEDSYFEAKEVRFSGGLVSSPHQDGLADELAAFANTSGGVCVLGIEDATNAITGVPIERLDSVEGFVREVCNDSIEPPLMAVIEKLLLPTEHGTMEAVLKIEVPRSLFVHKSPGGYFQRIGSSRRSMAPEFLARLFQQRSQARLIRFDEQVVPVVAEGPSEENLPLTIRAGQESPGERPLGSDGYRVIIGWETKGAVACRSKGVSASHWSPRPWRSPPAPSR